MLDCNLHGSRWSSCMDVPVPESEPRSGGWGRGGEGSKLWPPFSVTREPCSSLTGLEYKGTEWVLLPFCPSGTTCREEYCQYFLERESVWNTSQNLLRIYLPRSPCAMDHSSWSENAPWISLLLYSRSCCLPGCFRNVLAWRVCTGSWAFVQQLWAAWGMEMLSFLGFCTRSRVTC